MNNDIFINPETNTSNFRILLHLPIELTKK